MIPLDLYIALARARHQLRLVDRDAAADAGGESDVAIGSDGTSASVALLPASRRLRRCHGSANRSIDQTAAIFADYNRSPQRQARGLPRIETK